MEIRLRRAYDAPSADDGYRVLVDRVWPRGRSRDALVLEAWARDLAPSDGLRKWFGHDPARWRQFRSRYRAELARPEIKTQLDDLASRARAGTLTLVFGAADRERNQAVVLAEVLREHTPSGT
jgi:uncharacterized protein YeaO (DUF488 family)